MAKDRKCQLLSRPPAIRLEKKRSSKRRNWTYVCLRSIDKLSVTLLVDGRQKRTANPLEQAKQKRGHPLVEHLAEGQQLASGKGAHVGGYGRLGNVGDGNILAAAGIPTVQYGPGDIRIYKEWPTPDERVLLKDLVTAARAVAYATYKLCGERAGSRVGKAGRMRGQ